MELITIGKSIGPQVRHPTRGPAQGRGQEALHQGSQDPETGHPPAPAAQAPPSRSQAPPGREGQGRGREYSPYKTLPQFTMLTNFQNRTSTPRSLPSVSPRPRPTRPMPASDEQAPCTNKGSAFCYNEREKKGNHHTLVLWFACIGSEDLSGLILGPPVMNVLETYPNISKCIHDAIS